MAAGEVHVGDVGTVFIATVKDQDGVVVDVSSATTKELLFRSVNGKSMTKVAAFTTTGADGKIQYTTGSGDIDKAGAWSVQAHVVTGAGNWRSDVTQFTVYPNIG